ncbi:MAG: nitroreductase family deazaflavin-dependent oxidoreductase [Candidatus Hodarchaeales archaeon]|jgi:deazaflavin-dependent oxidoreductase (nitroreductase family)
MSWKYKVLKLPKIPYKLGLGHLLGKRILLLVSEGRKSKKLRITPLQYDIHKNCYFIGSMRGTHADWYKNIEKNHNVLIQLGRKTLKGKAIPISSTKKSLEFMKLRLAKHPIMLRLILFLDGVRNVNNQKEMTKYAKNIAFIKIKPIY